MRNQTEKVLVEVADLSYQANRKKILNSIHLKITKGDVLVITGPSGCGKTTLAKFINGELKPDSGELRYAENIKIEMVSQQDHFVTDSGLRTSYYGQRYENLNAEGIPTVASYFEKVVSQFQKVQLHEIARDLEIQSLLDRKILSLSNGERKRIQLAVALLNFPDLIILDQPFVGLDLHFREVLAQIITRLKLKDVTFIIISDPSHIPDFADTVLELNQGNIVRLEARDQYNSSGNSELKQLDSLNKEIEPIPYSQTGDFQVIVGMKNVNVSFGGKLILRNINWEVKSGELWLLYGHNGAGKTTLLSLITADNPQGYTNDLVLFDRKRGSGESIWDIKRKIGFVSPELHLYFLRRKSIYQPAPGTQMSYNSLTCTDVVLSGLNDEIGFNTSRSEQNLRLAKHWLQRLNMYHLEKSPFLHCSLGEQRIMLLARALIKNPDLLILDEPCQGLDPFQTERFIKLLNLICRSGKTTMIYVTHRAEEIPTCITHNLELENGKIKNCGIY